MALKESEKNRKKMWPGKSSEQDKREQNTLAHNLLSLKETDPNVSGVLNKCGKKVSFEWNYPQIGSTTVSVTAPSSTSTTMVSATAPVSVDRHRLAHLALPKQNRKTVQVQLKELGIKPVDADSSMVKRPATPPQVSRPYFLSALDMSPLPPPPGMDIPTSTVPPTPSHPKATPSKNVVTPEPLRTTSQELSTLKPRTTTSQQLSTETTPPTDKRPREPKQDGAGSRVTVQITMPQGNPRIPPPSMKTPQTNASRTTTSQSTPLRMATPRDTSLATTSSVSTTRPSTTPRSKATRLPKRTPSEVRSSKENLQRILEGNVKSPERDFTGEPSQIASTKDDESSLVQDPKETSSSSPNACLNLSAQEDDSLPSHNTTSAKEEQPDTQSPAKRSKSETVVEHQGNSSVHAVVSEDMSPTTPQQAPSKEDDILPSQYACERVSTRGPAPMHNWSVPSSPSYLSSSPAPAPLRSLRMRPRRPMRFAQRRLVTRPYPLSPMTERHQRPLAKESSALHDNRCRLAKAEIPDEWKWRIPPACYGQECLSLVTQGVVVPVQESHYPHADLDRYAPPLSSSIALVPLTGDSEADADDMYAWEDRVAARREAYRRMHFTKLAARAIARRATTRRAMVTRRADAKRFAERERVLRMREAEVQSWREELDARSQDLEARAEKLDERSNNLMRCQKAFHKALDHSFLQPQHHEEYGSLKCKWTPRRSRLDSRRVAPTHDGGEAAARTLQLVLRCADEGMTEQLRAAGIVHALALYACERDLPHLLRELHQRLGARADVSDKRGYTLLHVAAARGAVGAAKVLLFEMGSHLWEPTETGPKHAGRDGGNGDCFIGDDGQSGESTQTAMELALAGGHEDMVRFLADVDANMELVESAGDGEDDEGARYASRHRRQSRDRSAEDAMGGGLFPGVERRDGRWARDSACRHHRPRNLSDPLLSGAGLPPKRSKGPWSAYAAAAGCRAWRGGEYAE